MGIRALPGPYPLTVTPYGVTTGAKNTPEKIVLIALSRTVAFPGSSIYPFVAVCELKDAREAASSSLIHSALWHAPQALEPGPVTTLGTSPMFLVLFVSVSAPDKMPGNDLD